MAEERVVLTAELRDEASAPLGALSREINTTSRRVARSSGDQADAVARAARRMGTATGGVGRDMNAMATAAGRASGRTSAAVEAAAGRIRNSRGQFVSAGRSAGEGAAQGLSSGFSSGVKKVAGLVGAYFGAQMVGGFVKDAATASDATDKFKATMSFAGMDTSAIKQATADAKAYADQTVYDLPTIQKMTAQLASNGIKDYTGLTRAAGNLNAVAGGNAETFKSVAMVMTQTAGQGKLTTENWNQLSDAIPGAAGPLMKALEKAGAYTGNFRTAMEKGQISSDEFNKALMELGTKPVAVEAAKSTATFEGALGNLQATINSGLMKALDKIKPAATTAITALGSGLGKAMEWTGKAATGLYDLFVKGDFTSAFREAFNVEEDSPLVDVMFKIRDAAAKLPEAAKALWSMRTPIMVIAGLIVALLIPHWIRLGTESLVSAGKQKLAWLTTQRAAVQSTYKQLWGFAVIAAGWAATAAVATARAAVAAGAWLIALGPVGWIILVVAALVAAFVWAYNNVDWFRAGVDAAMKWVSDAVKVATDWIVGAWNNVVDWWNTTLMPAVAAVGKWFGDMFDGAVNLLSDFIGMFVDGWGMLVDFWSGVLLPAIQAVGDFFAPILDWIRRLIWNATTIAVALFYKLVDFWNGVLLPALQAVGKWFSDIFTWIYNTIVKPVVDLIVGAFNGIVDFWNGVLVPAAQQLGNWFMTVLNWIYTTIIQPVINLIVGAFNGIVDFWNGVLVPAAQQLGNWFMSILTWIYNTVIKPNIDLVVGAFGMLTDFWNNTLKPVLDTVGKWFSDIIGGAISGVKGWIDELVKGFQGFMSFVSEKLTPIVDGIKGTFEDLGKIIGDVLGKVGEFANNPLGGIQDWLGIKKDGNGQGQMPGASGGAVFSGGGVLGGYAPGRDVVPALLSPGESVLVPELTRAIGPSNIMALNHKYSGGRAAGSGPARASLPAPSSAGGGGGDHVEYHLNVEVHGGEPGSVYEEVKRAVADLEAERKRRVYA